MRVLTVIVGGRFHPGALERTQKLKKGEEVLLLREPSNPFDKSAVAVVSHEGVKLGFIPRADAPLVARAIDEFYGPSATVRADASTSLTIEWEN